MLDAVFSFRGRLNRLQHLLGALGLGGAIMILFMIFMMIIIGHGWSPTGEGAPPPTGLATVGLLLIVAAPAFLWISFSMQARRFRDIGWEPLYVIPSWIGADIIDFLLAKAFPSLAIGKSYRETVFGLMFGLGLSGALLFWPGRADGDSEIQRSRTPPAEPHRDRLAARARRGALQPSPAAVRAAAAPVRGAGPAPTGFGRRGL